ncbi:MAG TPA: hypothetical protein VMF09_06740 [Solirubrobacteraceae bacterium]|nr:hypothetical protein [Solirubrobacteraceae bacterium]
MNEALRCRRCGVVIGVYEPLVRLVGGRAHETSRMLEPDLADADGRCYHAACYHAACYESLGDDERAAS